MTECKSTAPRWSQPSSDLAGRYVLFCSGVGLPKAKRLPSNPDRGVTAGSGPRELYRVFRARWPAARDATILRGSTCSRRSSAMSEHFSGVLFEARRAATRRFRYPRTFTDQWALRRSPPRFVLALK